VLFTVVLVGMAFSGWWGSRDVSQEIDKMQGEMRQLDADKATAEALLSQQQNRETLERSRFVNSLISRKSFSWTQLFMDLERIVPPRVRVVSLQPQPGAQDQVALRLVVESDSRERALDLLRRMEESESFRQAREKSEHGKEPNGVQFEIFAFYAPARPRGTP
jgi:Tfp pilus assembly protein PilN